MSKYIINYRALLGIIAILVTASFMVLGCGETTDGFVTGPVTSAGQDETITVPADAANGLAPDEMMVPPPPSEPCQINGTAEVLFLSFNSEIAYRVVVNEKEVGILAPLGNLRATVYEGRVKWMLIPIRIVPLWEPITGDLFAKRCNRYQVKVDFNPNQTEPPKSEP